MSDINNFSASGSSGALNNTKKRKGEPLCSLQYNVSTSNSFDALSGDENDPIPAAKSKIPPVIIYDKLNGSLINKIHDLIKDVYMKFKGNRFEVFTKTLSDYNKVLEFAKTNKQQHYTFTPKENKELKLVLKNLPPSISETDIKEDLGDKNLQVNSVKQLFKKNDNGITIKLPIYIVCFAPNTNKTNVFSVKSVCHCLIVWEKYKSKIQILQCYKCQSFGHSSKNCFKTPKCVKCAGPHPSSDCIDSTSVVIKCANCGEPHSANNKACSVFKKVCEKRAVSQSNILHNPPISYTTVPPTFTNMNYPVLPTNKNNSIQLTNHFTEQNNNPANFMHTNLNVNNNSDNNSGNIFIDFAKELKNLTSTINLSKLKAILYNTLNKIKSTEDRFTKIAYVFEGVIDYFNEP